MDKEQYPWFESYPSFIPRTINPREYESLVDLFAHAVENYPDNTAYINLVGSIKYKELDVLTDHFAAFLQNEFKLKKGDKIAIMLPNLIQYPIVLFAALKAGLIVVNVNPLYTPRELENQLKNSKAKAIVAISNYAFNLQRIIKNTSLEHVIITNVGDSFSLCKSFAINLIVRVLNKYNKNFSLAHYTFKEALKIGSKQKFNKVQVGYDDLAFLQYTGGTTGIAKGAMLTHGNIVANVSQALGMYGSVLQKGKEKVVTPLPLYHIFAMTINCMLFVALGGTNLLITDPRNIQSFVKSLKKHNDISAMTGVNTLFNALNNNEDFAKIKFKNLRIVIGGGAAIHSGVEKRFHSITGLHILEGYGLTECSPLCTVCPPNLNKYTGSIGLPTPSTIIRIVDNDGNEIWDKNIPGELEVKGPQVMQGYYNNPQASEGVFDNGFVRTGDIAIWLDGGYIKLIDRLKDMILVSGFNVFPSEIEDVVSHNNKVLECACVGVPSDQSGEAIKLFVVKRDLKLTTQELLDYCKENLTAYKIPRYIEFVSSLPKSTIGKVLRRKLREEHART